MQRPAALRRWPSILHEALNAANLVVQALRRTCAQKGWLSFTVVSDEDAAATDRRLRVFTMSVVELRMAMQRENVRPESTVCFSGDFEAADAILPLPSVFTRSPARAFGAGVMNLRVGLVTFRFQYQRELTVLHSPR